MATRFLKESDFSTLSKKDLPGLYLGIVHGKKEIIDDGVVFLRFSERKRWNKIIHGGKFFLCTRVAVQDNVDSGIKNVAQNMSAVKFVDETPSLSQIGFYNNLLNKNLCVGCNYSFRSLSNGILPIDINNLDLLSKEKFPKDLDEMVSWESGFQRCAGVENRWGLWIFV